MRIDVNFDQNTSSLPSGFVAAVNYVVSYFDSLFTNNVTVTIDVGYGEIAGQKLSAGALGESETYYGPVSYSTARNAVLAQSAPGSSTLPATSPAPSGDTLYMASSEQKALGIIPDNVTLDGYVGFTSAANTFGYAINSAPPTSEYYFVGVVEHEFTEVMGRASYLDDTKLYSLMDLFRYSGANARQLTTGAASYFSINNGTTNLDNWNNFQTGNNGDLGDWAPSAGNDAFDDNSNPGVINAMGAVDLTNMNALGWQTVQNQPLSLSYVGFSDVNGSGDNALVWQNGPLAELWTNNGLGFTQLDVSGARAGPGWTPFGTSEDRLGTEMFWWNGPSGGQVQIWSFAGNNFVGSDMPGQMAPGWNVAGLGDFDGNGSTDILWQNGGSLYLWLMNQDHLLQPGAVNMALPAGWKIVDIGDFYGTKADSLLLQEPQGQLVTWQLSGFNVIQTEYVGGVGGEWRFAGVGKFPGDGNTDVVLVSTSNSVQIWDMQDGLIHQFIWPVATQSTQWRLQAVGDFNGSGTDQLMWMNQAGQVQLWSLNGALVTVTTPTTPTGDTLQLAPGTGVPSQTTGELAIGGAGTIGAGNDTVVGFGDNTASNSSAPGPSTAPLGGSPHPLPTSGPVLPTSDSTTLLGTPPGPGWLLDS